MKLAGLQATKGSSTRFFTKKMICFTCQPRQLTSYVCIFKWSVGNTRLCPYKWNDEGHFFFFNIQVKGFFGVVYFDGQHSVYAEGGRNTLEVFPRCLVNKITSKMHKLKTARLLLTGFGTLDSFYQSSDVTWKPHVTCFFCDKSVSIVIVSCVGVCLCLEIISILEWSKM